MIPYSIQGFLNGTKCLRRAWSSSKSSTETVRKDAQVAKVKQILDFDGRLTIALISRNRNREPCDEKNVREAGVKSLERRSKTVAGGNNFELHPKR